MNLSNVRIPLEHSHTGYHVARHTKYRRRLAAAPVLPDLKSRSRPRSLLAQSVSSRARVTSSRWHLTCVTGNMRIQCSTVFAAADEMEGRVLLEPSSMRYYAYLVAPAFPNAQCADAPLDQNDIRCCMRSAMQLRRSTKSANNRDKMRLFAWRNISVG